MIREGTKVEWNWGEGTAEGEVIKTYTEKVSKTIQGNEVIREGERGNKALYIKTDDSHVLKLESEVDRVDG